MLVLFSSTTLFTFTLKIWKVKQMESKRFHFDKMAAARQDLNHDTYQLEPDFLFFFGQLFITSISII